MFRRELSARYRKSGTHRLRYAIRFFHHNYTRFGCVDFDSSHYDLLCTTVEIVQSDEMRNFIYRNNRDYNFRDMKKKLILRKVLHK